MQARDRRGQQGRRRARPQDRDHRRGRSDQSRKPPCARAQADRGQQGAGHHGHLGLGGDRVRWRRCAGNRRPSCARSRAPTPSPCCRIRATSSARSRTSSCRRPQHARVHRRHWARRSVCCLIGIQAPFALSTQGAPRRRRCRARAPSVVGARHLREGQDRPTAPRSTRRCAPNPDFSLSQRLCAGHRRCCCATSSRANIDLPKFCRSPMRVTAKTLDTHPAGGVSRRHLHRPALGRHRVSRAFSSRRRSGSASPSPDSYEAQATDWASLVDA